MFKSKQKIVSLDSSLEGRKRVQASKKHWQSVPYLWNSNVENVRPQNSAASWLSRKTPTQHRLWGGFTEIIMVENSRSALAMSSRSVREFVNEKKPAATHMPEDLECTEPC